MKHFDFEFDIDRLVLDGFSQVEAAALEQAIQRALARLFAEQGLPDGWTDHGEVVLHDADVFRLPPGTDVEALGARIAEAIYGAGS